MRACISLGCLLLITGLASADLNIVPTPKVIEYSQAMPLLLGEDSVAIVLGDTAVEPEEYAAETLQKNVKKRFGQTWPIRRESEDLKAYKVLVLLEIKGMGQRSRLSAVLQEIER